ncbi:uncharacterized protein LOC132204693 [Neocloeon triangulifer]|uniref:uncharacterized protein LOC132204693 n=1 Tax=Neocloeon triangulifer TaxID=2078957 RepID=UPI00286F9A9B|nr:uncharacterized protein LOC132204693 [Neocloeon triangulifer]
MSILPLCLGLLLVSFGQCVQVEFYNQADFINTDEMGRAVTINDTKCASENFASNVAKCCNTPMPPLLSKTLISSTCTKSFGSAGVTWLNSYKINSLQAKTVHLVPLPLSKAAQAAICKPAQLAECVFKANSWMDANGNLDIVRFKKDVSADKNSAWVTTLEGILDPISSGAVFNAYPITDIIQDGYETINCTVKNSVVKVNGVPLMLLQLLQSEILWMCPEQKTFTNANKCMTTLRKFQFCDGRLFDSTGRGVYFFSTV